MHQSASHDVEALLSTLVQELEQIWGLQAASALLSAEAPSFWF